MLPYKTTQAAEEALGRRLTTAEWLWFSYSADMNQLWLYCHSAIVVILTFSLASLPLAILELRRPDVLDRYKLQPNVRVTAASMIKCYKDVVCTLVFAFGPLQLFSYPFIMVVFSTYYLNLNGVIVCSNYKNFRRKKNKYYIIFKLLLYILSHLFLICSWPQLFTIYIYSSFPCQLVYLYDPFLLLVRVLLSEN